MQTTFTTAKRTEISVAIITERAINADGHVCMVPCYDLQVLVGGREMSYCDTEQHPIHGQLLSLNHRSVLVPIPAESQDAVNAVISTYDAAVEDARCAEYAAQDAADNRHARVIRGMNA